VDAIAWIAEQRIRRLRRELDDRTLRLELIRRHH
jgi:hypothetical protein